MNRLNAIVLNRGYDKVKSNSLIENCTKKLGPKIGNIPKSHIHSLAVSKKREISGERDYQTGYN